MAQEPTNEDLLQAIAAGFESVDKRFASMEKRLDSVGNQLETHSRRLDRIEGHLASLRASQADLVDVLDERGAITKKDKDSLRSSLFGRVA